MRIWDLKQGTSLHVLKGREEFNHLGLSLTGQQPFPAGSDLCRGGEVAPSKAGGCWTEPGAGFLCLQGQGGCSWPQGCWRSWARWRVWEGEAN